MEKRYERELIPFNERKINVSSLIENSEIILKYPSTALIFRMKINQCLEEMSYEFKDSTFLIRPLRDEKGLMRHNEKYIDAMQQSKISINSFGRGYDCFRYYEILSHGCALFSQPLEKYLDLSAKLIPELDYVSFENEDELKNKLKYYLENENELRTIAENGRRKALLYYSSIARVNYLMDCLQFKKIK